MAGSNPVFGGGKPCDFSLKPGEKLNMDIGGLAKGPGPAKAGGGGGLKKLAPPGGGGLKKLAPPGGPKPTGFGMQQPT